MGALVFLFSHPGPPGGFHDGPGFFPGFLFAGPMFWVIPLIIFALVARSRHDRPYGPVRRVPPDQVRRAAPDESGPLWPDLASTPEAKAADDDTPRPIGPVEYL